MGPVGGAHEGLAKVSSGLTVNFGYDALGRRWTRTVNATQSDVLHDGLSPVQEGALPTRPAATLLTRLGLEEFFTRTDAAGLRAFLSDALGSTLALADAAGAVQTAYTYAPFGETTVTGTASANPYQFTGREHDGTGLYYYRARYYHPTLSRFASEDPLGFAGGDVNQYVYVRNNPVGFRDPTGTFSPITILGGAAGGAVTGAAAGALVGGISGFITSVAEGQSLGQAIQSGAVSAGSGAVAGGIVGGAVGAFAGGGFAIGAIAGHSVNIGLPISGPSIAGTIAGGIASILGPPVSPAEGSGVGSSSGGRGLSGRK